VCKWHDATFYQERTEPGNIVNAGRNSPQPAGRRHAVRKWHGKREASSGETGAWKSPPEGTTLRIRSSEEPNEYGRSRGDQDTPDRQSWTRGLKWRTLRRVMEYQMLDIVEGSTHSEAQEAMVQEEPGMRCPGHAKG
jgi:hypothetical protein